MSKKTNKVVEKIESLSGGVSKKDLSEQTQLLGLMLALGFTVAVCVCAGVLGGIWLDRQRWLPNGVGALIGAIAGLGLAIFWAWMRISRHLSAHPPPVRRKPPLFENHEDK
jgi:uncharacterized protein YneF (UPF0154 family)